MPRPKALEALARQWNFPLAHLASAPAEDLHTSQAKSVCAHRAKGKFHWRFVSWNVRSMLDTEGSIETARQGRDTLHAEDRKVDLVVRELGRYNIKVAALQETKWMGNAVYEVGESVLLTAGRPVPVPEQPIQRGEGVAVVLSGPAISAWKAGGQRWKAWSPRLISTCLATGSRKEDILHVLSCYAPTRSATRAAKEEFIQCVERALACIPSSEPYILLGDFNARVGSCDCADDPWSRVRGPHGYGNINDSGRELLEFLAVNEATVCNSWYKKRDIHKQTWMHPRSKQWHCIDYCIMRQRDRGRCLDVAVRRGAECNTDHQLLCVKIKMRRSHHYQKKAPKQQKFNVSLLARARDRADEGTELSKRAVFREQTATRTAAEWPFEGTAEKKWAVMKRALTETANECLGVQERYHPDWFKESAMDLQPVLLRRNKLYTKWLATKNSGDLRRFKKARGEAQRAIRRAKDQWFRAKAEEAERERFGGKKVWRCIRDLQRGRRGLRPSVNVTINDEDGNPCRTPLAQQQRWRRHFSAVLNIHSQFDPAELGAPSET